MPTLREFESWPTISEAAETIGVTRKTVYLWLDDGLMRAVQTRAGWLIDPESVEKFRRERKERKRERGKRNE